MAESISRTTRAKACWSSTDPSSVSSALAGLVLDEVAPQLDHLSRRFRRFAAGQLLADHQRQRFLERRILAAR
jgi:hypothetical protein